MWTDPAHLALQTIYVNSILKDSAIYSWPLRRSAGLHDLHPGFQDFRTVDFTALDYDPNALNGLSNTFSQIWELSMFQLEKRLNLGFGSSHVISV